LACPHREAWKSVEGTPKEVACEKYVEAFTKVCVSLAWGCPTISHPTSATQEAPSARRKTLHRRDLQGLRSIRNMTIDLTRDVRQTIGKCLCQVIACGKTSCPWTLFGTIWSKSDVCGCGWRPRKILLHFTACLMHRLTAWGASRSLQFEHMLPLISQHDCTATRPQQTGSFANVKEERLFPTQWQVRMPKPKKKRRPGRRRRGAQTPRKALSSKMRTPDTLKNFFRVPPDY